MNKLSSNRVYQRERGDSNGTMRRETDLYSPVKRYFANQGYLVRGEVRDCDLTAVKGEELVLVELKTAFNLDLVLQGVQRKRLSDDVYLAIPRPKQLYSPRWRKILSLCRALGLGLLAVSDSGLVEALCPPLQIPPRKNSRNKALLKGEFASRSGDYNTGGSRGRPLVTAYREKALLVAHCLGQGLQRPREIRAATGIASAPSLRATPARRNWRDRVL